VCVCRVDLLRVHAKLQLTFVLWSWSLRRFKVQHVPFECQTTQTYITTHTHTHHSMATTVITCYCNVSKTPETSSPTASWAPHKSTRTNQQCWNQYPYLRVRVNVRVCKRTSQTKQNIHNTRVQTYNTDIQHQQQHKWLTAFSNLWIRRCCHSDEHNNELHNKQQWNNDRSRTTTTTTITINVYVLQWYQPQ